MTGGAISIFGIRHHGPGSAKSLLRALDELRPDIVLIEGPPEADALIASANHEAMTPPVAILVYDIAQPKTAVYYPFAEFSPEWQALRWAARAKAPALFMDLPQAHRMAMQANPPSPQEPQPTPMEPDPLSQLARAAGFDDGERWWEHVVEHRADGGLGMFAAVMDAMSELRQANPRARDGDEPYREAWMRRTIRVAQRARHENIAVVCGAWHAPALREETFSAKADDALLRGLPKVKTTATWIPWTHERLMSARGYGAGVAAPAWYAHLWQHDSAVIETWMTRVAQLLRKHDIDCSSAHVIEAVRLSTTLATLRRRPLADLSDLADAVRAVFCFDSDAPMRLISHELLVGDVLGSVPDDIPQVPLAQDLLRLQKTLRLKQEAAEKLLDLDLRNGTDLSRSMLLHRLRVLDIPWGQPDAPKSTKGTFHEFWRLRWQPEFAVAIVEAGALGNTVEDAAGARLRQMAQSSEDLANLAGLLGDAMLADLGQAVAQLVGQIENAAAIATDVTLLMKLLPGLAEVMRYGNVRQTDQTLVRHIVDGVMPRVIAGLSPAVSSLNDEAAAAFDELIRQTHVALRLIEVDDHTAVWQQCLLNISGQDTVHGLIRGRIVRLLMDAGELDAEQAARRMGLVLSSGSSPETAARWIEGFFSGSGLVLVHDRRLLDLLDAWLGAIAPERFDELLPLLRRTFATFAPAERRQMAQALKRGAVAQRNAEATLLDEERGRRALGLLVQIYS